MIATGADRASRWDVASRLEQILCPAFMADLYGRTMSQVEVW